MFEENWDDPNSVPVTPAQYNQHNDSSGRSCLGRGRRVKRNSDEKFGTNNSRQNNKLDKCINSSDWRRKRTSGANKSCIKVDSSKIGKIIGKQGCKIKELEEKTGAKIKIGDPREDDFYTKTVIIIGQEESIKECQKLIEELVIEKPLKIVYEAPKPEVPVIDWDTINALAAEAEAERWAKCPPLKKDFYVEDEEVSNMTEEEVAIFRKENNNIGVNLVLGGDDKILNPVKTFAQAFKHYPDILKEIEKQGFENPSPIQSQAWPVLMSGKDLIGIAQTGTGKTLAFLLPALIHIDGQEVPRSERGGANVLIIAPTRELALQIENEVQKYSYKGIKSVCVYGGGNRREQMKVVTDGVEIIIATPGRLNDLIENRVIDLRSVTYLVLDEADRMLDMGFEPQIRKVLLDIRPDRQSVMTSATWPAKVQHLAERYMCNPVQVYIGSLDLAAVHSVTQTVLIINEEEKKDYLFDFIRNLTKEDKIIVFVSKKVIADLLSCDLALAQICCQSIHGDREQMDREQALDDFKSGAVRILIATDVASRGLDISDITKVFNYDFPRNIEEYVHRVGRTGRAGKKGEAITLFTRGDRAFAKELIALMEEADQPVPEELYHIRDKFLSIQQRKKEETERNRYMREKDGGGRRKYYNDFSDAF